MSKLNNEILVQEKNMHFWINQAKEYLDHSAFVNAAVAIGRTVGLYTARQLINGKTEFDTLALEALEQELQRLRVKYQPPYET